MCKISAILVPLAFSESAKRALEYVVAFVGSDDNIQIVLTHISGHVNFQLLPENFTKLEEKYSGVLKNKLEWNLRRRVDPSPVGHSKNKGDKQGNPEQTNTSKLVLEADCLVLVIPRGHQDFRLKRIAPVLGNEEIDDAEDLVTLLEVARRLNAKVHVGTIGNRTRGKLGNC